MIKLAYYQKYEDNWACYCPDDVRERFIDVPEMVDVLHRYGGHRKHGGSGVCSDAMILFEEIYELKMRIKKLAEDSL